MSACASIVSGTDSTTYLETKPVDARCRMHGQDFTREVVTPTSVPLPSKASPITIECGADGYLRTVQQVDAEMDGWVFGNLIFGGIIGGVVDIARGAGKKFPPQVQIVLDPAAFKSEAERDQYFNDRSRLENERWDKVVAIIRGQCPPDAAADCNRRVEEVETKRRQNIDRVEVNRRSSRIVSG
jgi:hypothetical protein